MWNHVINNSNSLWQGTAMRTLPDNKLDHEYALPIKDKDQYSHRLRKVPLMVLLKSSIIQYFLQLSGHDGVNWDFKDVIIKIMLLLVKKHFASSTSEYRFTDCFEMLLKCKTLQAIIVISMQLLHQNAWVFPWFLFLVIINYLVGLFI